MIKNAEQHLASLRDGRDVYLRGQKIDDVRHLLSGDLRFLEQF